MSDLFAHLLGWVKRSDIEIVQIRHNLIELSDLIGFGYDLSHTQDELRCWTMGFIFCGNDKDSGERSRGHGTPCLS